MPSNPLPCDRRVDLFFSPEDDDIAAAKLLCGSCPAQDLCFAQAVLRHEPVGVWGGIEFHIELGQIEREAAARTAAARPAPNPGAG